MRSTRRGLAVLLALMLAGGCNWIGAGNGSGLPPAPSNATPQPTLAFLQANIFNAICAACHVGATAPQGLKLDGNNPCSNLVCVPSTWSPSLLRVQPGDPDNSLLVMKVEGTQGNFGIRMPANGPPYLDQATIDVIRQWITDGAECDSVGEATPSCATAPGPEDPDGPWSEALRPWLAEAARQARRVRAVYAAAPQDLSAAAPRARPGPPKALAAADREALELLDLAARPGCPWFLGVPGSTAARSLDPTPREAGAARGTGSAEDGLLAKVAKAVGGRDPAAIEASFVALARAVASHAAWHEGPPPSAPEQRTRLARLLHGVASLRVLPATAEQATARDGFLLHLLASDALSPELIPWLDGITPPRPAPGLPQLAWALDAAAKGITVEPSR